MAEKTDEAPSLVSHTILIKGHIKLCILLEMSSPLNVDMVPFEIHILHNLNNIIR